MMQHIIDRTIFIQITVNEINMLKLNFELDATFASEIKSISPIMSIQ